MIIEHTCGSCNFGMSVRSGFPLHLDALERLHHFIVALPSMSAISIHLAPSIVIEFWDFTQRIDIFLSGCIFKTCLIASQVFYTFVKVIEKQ